MQAKKTGDGSFNYHYIMIDKSKAEMAAIRGIGAKFLLCFFHLGQDWERFLRSSESGVRNAEERHAIMLRIAHLKRQQNEALFQHEVRACLPACL